MDNFEAICNYCGMNFGELKDHAIELSLHIRDTHEHKTGLKR